VIGHQVGLHEHRAALGQLQGRFGGECDVLELTDDIDAVFVGEFMQEAARSAAQTLFMSKSRGWVLRIEM